MNISKKNAACTTSFERKISIAHAHNKHERNEIEKRKLKKLYEETKYGCEAGAWQKDDGRIVKYWTCPNARKWLKRCCSKATRKMKEVADGSAYKRIFDYWWSLT